MENRSQTQNKTQIWKKIKVTLFFNLKKIVLFLLIRLLAEVLAGVSRLRIKQNRLLGDFFSLLTAF